MTESAFDPGLSVGVEVNGKVGVSGVAPVASDGKVVSNIIEAEIYEAANAVRSARKSVTVPRRFVTNNLHKRGNR